MSFLVENFIRPSCLELYNILEYISFQPVLIPQTQLFILIRIMIKSIILIGLLLPFVSASCNIDSAGLKTYSTSDGQVITRVGVVATFRLGCSQGTAEPELHAETSDGQYLAVSNSLERPGFKSVGFVEELAKSKSRWIEINVYDDATYLKLVEARNSGSSLSSFTPLKTISHGHYGIYSGPLIKMETVATLALIALAVFAHSVRNKIVN